MKQRKWHFLDLLMLVVFFIGIASLTYPFVSDAINDSLDQLVIRNYQKKAKSENEQKMAAIQRKMVEENQRLAEKVQQSGTDPFSSEGKEAQKSTKTYIESHTVGVLTIPKINVELPIFDETNPTLLEKGACLLGGTSYPVGGESTHAVLSSHRGLPQAKLFTDLPKLKHKDRFYIEINGQYLAYQVDQIKTVEPTETEGLEIQAGQDLVTLVTCTPYMVNSHRLLVRGHRVPLDKKEVTDSLAKVKKKKQQFILLVILGVSSFLLLFLVMLLKYFTKEKK
ncbi:class C sortase [Enterococcus hirae]|nr:class C sortase [Enterococcus hirae]